MRTFGILSVNLLSFMLLFSIFRNIPTFCCSVRICIDQGCVTVSAFGYSNLYLYFAQECQAAVACFSVAILKMAELEVARNRF